MEPEQQQGTRRQIIAEVVQCALCLEDLIYWGGDFRHLTRACPVTIAQQRAQDAGRSR
jgi:hypothetical protein